MNFGRIRTFALGISAVILLTLSGSGCRGNDGLIQKLVFTPSDNLETVRVALVFNPLRVQSTLAAGFTIKQYGYLFLNPYTEQSPFEVGFELNTAIIQDPDYVDLTPTTVFPNGISMNLPHAVVEVKADNPIGERFDLYAYVDVLHRQWMGVAVMLGFIDKNNFPPGLSITQVFMRNEEGKAGAIGTVFGPELNGDGSVSRSGGIAVMANIRQLMDQLQATESLEFYPESGVIVQGHRASRYRSRPAQLLNIEDNVIHGLNRH